MKLPRISYAFVLPIAELALWPALVLVPTLLMCERFYLIQQHEHATTESREFDTILPGDRWLGFSLEMVSERQFRTILNLNLPGALIGAPLSVPMVSYLRAHPSGLSVQAWLTVTMPFFCLPAWWLVGLGMDAAFTRKRMRLVLRLVGSILFCVCVAFVVGSLTSPPSDRKDLFEIMPGAICWAAAFGLFPFNWILTSRSRTNSDG